MLRTILVLAWLALWAGLFACHSTSPRPDDGTMEGNGSASTEFSARWTDQEPTFHPNAFPPTIPPLEFHEEAWENDNCLLCHAKGAMGAPIVRHRGMSPRLLQASCRTCHVPAPPGDFAPNAFPPTLPADDDHAGAWSRDDCLDCHESGLFGAPRVRHRGMSPRLLQARCRTCHVPAGVE